MSVRSDYDYRAAVSKYFAPPPAPTMKAVRPVSTMQPVAQTQEQAEPEKKKEKGTVDKLFGGIGSTLGVAGDILDLSGKYMARPLLGAGAKLMASEEVQGVANALGTGMSKEEAEKIRNAESLTAAWRAKADQEGVDWWEEMIAEVVADPTTWISAGGVAAIRAVPWVAKAAQASPKVNRALMEAESAAGLAERVQALPLTAPFAGIRAATRGGSKVSGKLRSGQSDILDPITGEPIGRGLLDQTPKSVLTERISEVDDALRTTVGRGAVTRGADQRGQFGFSATSGVDSLYGSNAAVGARRTGEELQGQSYGAIRSSLRTMGTPELADLYKNTPENDPLFPHLESVMIDRGLVTKTTTPGVPGGFKSATTTSVDDVAIDRSRQARQQMFNTPGIKGATPQVTDNADDTMSNVLKFVRHEAGLGANARPQNEPFIRKNLETMIERNAGMVDAPALWAHKEVRADLARAMASGSEQEARQHLATAFTRINAKQSARGVLHPWAAGIVDKYIPMIDKTKDNINIPAVNQYAVNGSIADDKQMRAMEKVFEDHAVQTKQKAWEKDGDKIAEIFKNTPGVGTFSDNTTIQDIDNVYHLLSPEDQKWVDAYRKRWKIDAASFEGSQSRANRVAKIAGQRDVSTYTMSDAYIDNITDTWATSTANLMGIKNAKVDPNLMGKLAWVPKAWREQALISPRYQFVNGMDMGVKSALHGVNGIENRGAAKTAEALGTELPRGIFVGMDTIDLGNISQEFASPSASSVLPGPLGWVSKMNRGISRGMENSFREWAWDNGMKDVLHGYKPVLHDQIRAMNPTKADAIIADLEQTGTYATVGGKRVNTKRDNGILFSPDQLHEIARKHGASTQQANDLARQWQGVVQQGSQAGVEMSNKVHFDFDKTYNIEDKLFLKKIMPFHFFATRNIPGYAQTLANRPEVVNAWMAYQDASEQDRIDMGLPDRLDGMVSIGDGFLDNFLGPNKVFFNPMSAISFVDQTKNVGLATEENEFAEPAKLLSRRGIGTLLEKTAKMGVGGPAPWIQIPLSVVGVTSKGAKDETMPILRHSGLADSLLGFDLGESQARGVINEARAAFHNGERVETHTGSQFRDNQIVTKMQETMQSYIDAGNDPTAVRDLFVQASKDGPGNELWDKAAEQVQSEQGQRDVRNFWFPFPTKDTTDQGNRLSAARESKPEGLLDNDTVVELLKHFGDPAVANRGFRRPSLVDRQGDPIFTDRATGKRETEADREAQKDAWGGDNWGPEREYPYNSDVVYNLWQQYKAGLSDPTKARVSDFFKMYEIPGR